MHCVLDKNMIFKLMSSLLLYIIIFIIFIFFYRTYRGGFIQIVNIKTILRTRQKAIIDRPTSLCPKLFQRAWNIYTVWSTADVNADEKFCKAWFLGLKNGDVYGKLHNETDMKNHQSRRKERARKFSFFLKKENPRPQT